MKLKDYIKDKLKDIFVSCTMILLLILMLMVFKVKISFIIAIIIVIVLSLLFIFFNNFIKRKIYYDNFINTLNNIDKKYLISEMITRPNFLEGKILYDSIYAIDKSMNDKINNYKYSIENLKDYIEMWIHEVKIPLSNLLLISHNNKKDPKITKEISRIENYIDQVLYYFRSENAENDYLIKKYDLKKIINICKIFYYLNHLIKKFLSKNTPRRHSVRPIPIQNMPSSSAIWHTCSQIKSGQGTLYTLPKKNTLHSLRPTAACSGRPSNETGMI